MTVRRWTRYGKDRLYVKLATGQEVGYFDLLSGREVVRLPAYAIGMRQAVAEFRASGAAHPATRSVPDAGPGPVGVSANLADVRPGAAVAAQVAAIRARHPVWTRIAPLFGIRTADRSWRAGEYGEREVGARLDRLARREGWYVLHSVMLGSSRDVDHLVFGPSGVYCINTKHHRGKRVRVGRDEVSVAGRPTRYADKARDEARLVSARLSAAAGTPVHVTPVLVFVAAAGIQGWRWGRPRQVKVLPLRRARRWLRWQRGDRIGVNGARQLYELACVPATWHTG
ncbi:MAG TPA: nuclease-related domain-containing protein [Mycobacteriales bacterium]